MKFNFFFSPTTNKKIFLKNSNVIFYILVFIANFLGNLQGFMILKVMESFI